MPIRLYFPIGNLPFQFKIPAGYAYNFFATITVFLIRKFKPLIYWRTPEQTLSYKHLHFSGDFNKVEEGIGDCTKQCNQRSSNPKVQYQTYSTYKSHSTVKNIFICTKSVWISYISDEYTVSATDRFITEDTNIAAQFKPAFLFYLIKNLIYKTYFYNIKKLQECLLLLQVKDSLQHQKLQLESEQQRQRFI